MALADIVYYNVYKHATRHPEVARELSRYTVLVELIAGFPTPLQPILDDIEEQEEDDL